MKTCPHCSKVLITNRKKKSKKWKLGYSVSKCKPASNSKYSWEGSGWGIPESLKPDDWDKNPSFSRDAYYQEKGFYPEYYTTERSHQ